MSGTFSRTVLPSGARLILIPMPGVSSVATSVMVGVGSRYEEPEVSGISHFLEHMVFKGTNKYPTTDDVNIVEKNGGLQNAYTDVDITNYHNKVLASDWAVGLDVNTQLALHPLLEQKHIDMERNVIIEEMKRYEDEPSAKVEEVFHHLMYPDTPLGRRIIGTAESLHFVQAHTMKAYHNRWYQPSKIVIVLAGKLEDEKAIIQQVAEQFGSLPSTKVEDFQPLKVTARTTPYVEILTKPQALQANLELGVHTFSRKSSDRFGWNVFNVLMGVSFTSRLFREIRERRGLCYHIRSSNNNWAETGYWSIFAGVATEKVLETIAAIREEITKVVQSGVTKEEVSVAQKRIRTMLAFRAEDPEFMNEFYGRQEVFGEPIIELSEYLSRVESVTPESVNNLIHTYLGHTPLNMALVWNQSSDSDEFISLLK